MEVEMDRERIENGEDSSTLIDRVEKMPLYMQYTPEDGEAEDNPDYQAIKALQAEETPEEMAENYKDSGNEAYKRGKLRYQDALRYYELALEQKCSNRKLNAQVYSNRAQVHLALENYGYVIRDSDASIALDPDNVKSYYRAAKASMSLSKYGCCVDYCRKGLLKTQDLTMKKTFRSMIAKAKEKLDALKSKELEERKKVEEKETSEKLFLEACSVRKLKFENSAANAYRLTANRYEISHHYNREDFELHWSVLLLYPEYNTSDFVQDWNESISVLDMLLTIFPSKAEFENTEGERSTISLPEWDRDQVYYMENLQVSVELKDGSLKSVTNLDMSLRKVLVTYVKVIDAFPVFQITPKTKY